MFTKAYIEATANGASYSKHIAGPVKSIPQCYSHCIPAKDRPKGQVIVPTKRNIPAANPSQQKVTKPTVISHEDALSLAVLREKPQRTAYAKDATYLHF